ncbi:hypothetical protein DFH29DRAFT_761920, partial [Suillus ampliporus]
SYLAITAHWMSEHWQLQSELLSFSEIQGSHSGENLGTELYNILKQFGICDK